MSKKVSIANALDLNKLNREIDIYISKTNETKPYLFMNENTINALPCADDALSCLNQINAKVIGIVGYYEGYKIFKDNSLNFGEIEIR